MKITNEHGISLAMQVWLLHDEYDYQQMENYISVTSLMKPIRQIILPRRIPLEGRVLDVSELASRALGTALHDSIEKAWTNDHVRTKSLIRLGYPKHVAERVRINPTDELLKEMPDCIPIYLEQRAFKKITINGKTYTVGGKFDMVAEGIVHDNKSTSAYTWVHGGRDDEHKMQGSLYRWLNPEKITEDFIRIEYIFTDWQKSLAKTNPKYPQQRMANKDIPLDSIIVTDRWVKDKLVLVDKLMEAPESELPECTPDELWMSDPKYKYYADPAKTAGRSTKNFDSLAEARKHIAEKGGKGIIITEPGQPKRCEYCDAFDACKQKDRYFP
jgi:hypothetical protein